MTILDDNRLAGLSWIRNQSLEVHMWTTTMPPSDIRFTDSDNTTSILRDVATATLKGLRISRPKPFPSRIESRGGWSRVESVSQPA